MHWLFGDQLGPKPYTSGGAYVNRMSDLCGSCPHHPEDRHRSRLERNHRMTQAVRGPGRLAGLPDVRRQERSRRDSPP